MPSKLNWLEQNLPEGLVVDAAWLSRRGYASNLRSQYVKAGWLKQPARGVFMRPRGMLRWEQVVISLQTLLELALVVGGRTALELQGYAHYLPQKQREVHLYGLEKPPAWLGKLPLDARFVFHRDGSVFRNDPITRFLTSRSWDLDTGESHSDDPLHGSFTQQRVGHWREWPLTLSTPERALLELLNELPSRESFYQVDKLVEGLVNLSPRRLQKLLEDCHSVKVKRLFFFFADRHRLRWLKHLNRSRVDLGTGKRMLVAGGKLDPNYNITVPGDLDAVQ